MGARRRAALRPPGSHRLSRPVRRREPRHRRGYDTTWAGTIAWRRLRRRAATCWIASGSTHGRRRRCARFGPPTAPCSPSPARCRTPTRLAGSCSCSTSRPRPCPAENARTVWAALRRCADGGHTVLFVSHRLEEVTTHADAVTVLRDGHLAATLTARRDHRTAPGRAHRRPGARESLASAACR